MVSYQPVGYDGQRSILQALVLENDAVAPPVKASGIRVGCCLYDSEEDKSRATFQGDWNGFLRLYNFYQFLPYSYFVTSDGMAKKEYGSLKLYEEPVVGTGEQQAEPDDTGWTEIKELTDEAFHSLLDTLKKEGWPVPEAGYELEGTDGEVIGSAEFAWEELKVAFLTEIELEYLQAFTDKGWKGLSLQDVLENPDQYINLKNNQGE